ncbi:MAG TPA: sterol desaturase family protein [Rudaea sp.]
MTTTTPDPLPQAQGYLARLSTTRANARAGLVADSGVSILLIAAGLWFSRGGALVDGALIAAGLLAFSLVEYGFHRWLFHGRPSSAQQGHGKHHDDPHGYDALPFFLPVFGMLALAASLSFLMPAGAAMLLAGAIAAGYAGYGLAHTAIHAVRFRHPVLVRWAASHHIHHYHPERNFGVTTPLWDYVFGTRYVPQRAVPSVDR